MSSKLRLGDVFEVQMDPSSKRVFQYVSDDGAQLHSNVVRIFCRNISGRKTNRP